MGSSESDVKKESEQTENVQIPDISITNGKTAEQNYDIITHERKKSETKSNFKTLELENTDPDLGSFVYDHSNGPNDEDSYTYTEVEVSYEEGDSNLYMENEFNKKFGSKQKKNQSYCTNFVEELENEKTNDPDRYKEKNEKSIFIQKIFRENLENIEKKNHGPSESKGKMLEYIPSDFKSIIKNYQAYHGSYLQKIKEKKQDNQYDNILQGLEDSPNSTRRSMTPDTFSSKYITLSSVGSTMNLKRIKLGAFIDAKDGSLYLGEWNCGRKHGEGFLVWETGIVYEGYFENDKLQGKGRLQFYDPIKGCPNRYEGDWFNSKMHGFGDFINNSKKCYYKGQWEFDKQHGCGTERYSDKSSYHGYFEESKKNGIGTFDFIDGKNYHGEFKDDMITGKGIFKYPDGRFYEGEFINNCKEGVGLFFWPDGRLYEGCYLADKKEGYGKMTWPNGQIWEGSWKNGLQHGYGTSTDKTGIEIPQLVLYGKVKQEMVNGQTKPKADQCFVQRMHDMY